VYKYNNVQCWVSDINLLDDYYVFIPTNNNKLHWMLFIIVPDESRVECYDSRYDANVFHYESLNVFIKFINDYKVSNKLPVDGWAWSVKIVCDPKQTTILTVVSLFA
jgi:Ulp1 family protease